MVPCARDASFAAERALTAKANPFAESFRSLAQSGFIAKVGIPRSGASGDPSPKNIQQAESASQLAVVSAGR